MNEQLTIREAVLNVRDEYLKAMKIPELVNWLAKRLDRISLWWAGKKIRKSFSKVNEESYVKAATGRVESFDINQKETK